MSKKNKNNSLTKFKTNMADNIDAMESLMTIMDCEMYVIEHILLCAGECWHYDLETETIVESFLTITSTDEGDINILITHIETNSTMVISPLEAYTLISKDKDELELVKSRYS